MKLIDFGLATFEKHDNKSVGTPCYMSPETIDGNSTPLSDMWSVGVIVYQMITGKLPFESIEKDNQILYNKIKNDDYDKDILNEIDCSDEVKDFIYKTLQKDTKLRLNTEEGLNHPWILKFCIKSIESDLINEETIEIFLEFARKNLLQKEIYYFIAKVSNESDIDKFKIFFNQLDSHNMGSLSFEEIKEGFECIEIDDNILEEIFNGLNYHKSGKINYSEFLSAMVSSKNFPKEEKLTSVFNLLNESEINKNYITFESLMNAAKALNLNINEEDIKKCFQDYDNEISFEDFKKLILNDDIDKKSYGGEMRHTINKELKFKRKMTKHKTH